MGDEEYNKKLYLQRMEERPRREVHEPVLWAILDELKKERGTQNLNIQNDEKVSFLN